MERGFIRTPAHEKTKKTLGEVKAMLNILLLEIRASPEELTTIKRTEDYVSKIIAAIDFDRSSND